MKKIGILTLSASDNCGSLLQTFALKTILESMGTNAEVINFFPKGSHAIYDIVSIWRLRHHPHDFFLRLKNYNRLKKMKDAYRNFRVQYLFSGVDASEENTRTLKRVGKKYDVIIVGSDQIWNYQMADFDVGFLLPEVSLNKVAYGASLGGCKLSKIRFVDDVRRCLEDFERISVRENAGAVEIEKIIGKRPTVVTDPTLLVSVEVWEKMSGEKAVKEEYIFYYSWAYETDVLNEIVYAESLRLNIPVYVIDYNKWVGKRNTWGFYIVEDADPLKFLNLMKHARKCFVESFHGVIFAYIFKKDFWVLNVSEDVEKDDVRLFELSRILEIEDRFFYPGKDQKCLENEMVYEKNIKLKHLVKKSRKFLEESIESCINS